MLRLYTQKGVDFAKKFLFSHSVDTVVSLQLLKPDARELND